MSILLQRLLSGGCCPGQGQSCPRHYRAMVQKLPVLRAIECILKLQGPQDKLSCRSLGCPPVAGGKPLIWIFEIHWAWCDAQKYIWVSSMVCNRGFKLCFGSGNLRAGDQIYLCSTENNATGGRKAEASLTSSLWATINVSQSSANANFKND